MDKLMINIIESHNNKPLDYGVCDCNTIWLEIFEPEMYEQILGTYATEIGGARKANKLFGHTNIKSFVDSNDGYNEIHKNYVGYGCFFIKGKHVAICLGTKTFALDGGVFKPVPTKFFLADTEQTIYKKEI